MKMKKQIDFLIVPENIHWGGSELLWSQTALILSESGYLVKVLLNEKMQLPNSLEMQFKQQNLLLQKTKGAKLTQFQKLANRFLPYALRFKAQDNRCKLIEALQPKLVLVNQGFNFNGVSLMKYLNEKKIDYVSISHAVNELHWPNVSLRKDMLEVFNGSKCNYFVSQDNLEVTQMQLGVKILKVEVVRNPFQVSYQCDFGYPQTGGYHLACVGRYEFNAKGQDVILRVLMQDKWKQRPLKVHFFGNGNDLENLQDIVSHFKLSNVEIHSFTNTEDIWKNMQGLILASRFEGLPISLVEAMLCKRMAIVTNVSGNAEVVSHGETGFIAAAPRPEYLDEALEQAWACRESWEFMGKQAEAHIKTLIPEYPERVFAEKLIKHLL